MGWLLLGGIALGAAVILGLIGFPRRLWMVAATAMTLGAAGYALQGNPGLDGHPVTTAEVPVQIDPDLVELRQALFGRFNYDDAAFTRADAMMRIGATDSAVRAMEIAVRGGPEDVGAWTGLALTLADHDRGLSPAARFAFERAMALQPNHPGPPFFYGLTLARGRQFGEARQWWARAVALAPPTASYRPAMVQRLAVLDQFLAQVDAAQKQQQQGQGQAPAP